LLGIGYDNSDRGELIIENGASVTSRRGVIGFADYSQGMATVTGEGSTWTVANDIELNRSTIGFPTPIRNLLKVENGGRVTVGGHVEIYSLGIVAGDGGTIVGDVLNITGVVAPGVLTIDGDYTQEIGSLLIDLAGTTPGAEYDRLIVTGDAALGGWLEVSLIDEFMPSIGSSFDILDSASTSRAFTHLLLPPLASGSWDTRQLYTTGVISVIETTGDYNDDGVVDSADYVVWRKDPSRLQSEYDAWRANFGRTTTIASGSEFGATVPEPASPLLYLAALATCALMHASSRTAMSMRARTSPLY
jgi:T5SS/PEP-CTERM-associated repeat protein